MASRLLPMGIVSQSRIAQSVALYPFISWRFRAIRLDIQFGSIVGLVCRSGAVDLNSDVAAVSWSGMVSTGMPIGFRAVFSSLGYESNATPQAATAIPIRKSQTPLILFLILSNCRSPGAETLSFLQARATLPCPSRAAILPMPRKSIAPSAHPAQPYFYVLP